MKYKVNDRVRIKSLDWYNENRNYINVVKCGVSFFVPAMTKHCGYIRTISKVFERQKVYHILEDNNLYTWTDEMIEGLVEEESLSQEEFAEQWSKFDINKAYNKILEEKALKQYEVPTGSIKIWDLPEGYQFTDENGNVINATKIVLEKQKKEYPKTFRECCEMLDIDSGCLLASYDIGLWKDELFSSLQKLLICRDAYWKIAGEEMGLGKPWEPSDNSEVCYGIFNWAGKIQHNTTAKWCILTFPTEEMRDAFYENFKELIEQCKELL